METIEQIYASDVYRPFVRFCQLNGLREMQQLDSRVLARAASWPGMNAQLLARVKLVYTTYRKKNPPAVPPASAPATTPRLEEQVRAYFGRRAEAGRYGQDAGPHRLVPAGGRLYILLSALNSKAALGPISESTNKQRTVPSG